jgi:large subunit ribosomal protein L23
MSFLINYDKIKGLIHTEKSSQQMSLGKYCFKIDFTCSKKELHSAITKIFSVEIKKINLMNTKSKIKRFKGVEGKRSSYKKAIVTLKEGQSINFSL